MTQVSVSAVCTACKGTGLYVGFGERDGAVTVTSPVPSQREHTVTYEPFVSRADPPEGKTRVHVARGYGLSEQHPLCDGGMPIEAWEPGVVVPADEKLYCPFLYTNQKWCAHPDPKWGGMPGGIGSWVSDCPLWSQKAECWERYHAAEDAPKVTS